MVALLLLQNLYLLSDVELFNLTSSKEANNATKLNCINHEMRLYENWAKLSQPDCRKKHYNLVVLWMRKWVQEIIFYIICVTIFAVLSVLTLHTSCFDTRLWKKKVSRFIFHSLRRVLKIHTLFTLVAVVRMRLTFATNAVHSLFTVEVASAGFCQNLIIM